MARQAEPDFSSHQQRWQAVQERDPRAHDAFLYAVQTTGIYCRPTCPARRPRPNKVRFFLSPAEAERAGFRPCQRCRPDLPGATASDERIVQACRLLERAGSPPSLKKLAAAVNLSPYHFQRLFKRKVGVTPKQYGDWIRRQRLQSSLQQGAPVTRAVYEAGFGSSSRVHEKSRSLLGMTPSQYRRQGRNQRIQYALGRSSLGWVLVAASEHGICALELGDSRKPLLASLKQRFARGDLRPGDASFERLLARVLRLLEHPAEGLDLPLDIQGSAFQQRVWQALQQIPPGATASYGELARRLGQPGAARAVAGACAANPVAVAVPCHRAVRADGGLAGYRWGPARKRELLERERAAVEGGGGGKRKNNA